MMVNYLKRSHLLFKVGLGLVVVGLLFIIALGPNKAERTFSLVYEDCKDALVDPESIRIDEATYSDDTIYIEFSGKNGFGAYTSDRIIATHTFKGDSSFLGETIIVDEDWDEVFDLVDANMGLGTPFSNWVIEGNMKPTVLIGIIILIIGLLSVGVTFTPLMDKFIVKQEVEDDSPVDVVLTGNQKIYQDLDSLKKLFDKEILSEEEYLAKKEKLLSQIE